MSVESLCEQLIGIDRSSAGQCHLLMQPAVERSEMGEAFDALLESAGIQPIPIAIRQIPKNLWPFLIPLDLSKGMHSLLSGQAVEMAMAQRSASSLLAARPQRACAWVWTPLLTPQLARQLAERGGALPACAGPEAVAALLRPDGDGSVPAVLIALATGVSV